jgi:hypothetical protein
METSQIVLIVGVALLFLERILSFAVRIKKSRCCGNEIEMRTPEKTSASLAESQNVRPEDEIEKVVKRLSQK